MKKKYGKKVYEKYIINSSSHKNLRNHAKKLSNKQIRPKDYLAKRKDIIEEIEKSTIKTIINSLKSKNINNKIKSKLRKKLKKYTKKYSEFIEEIEKSKNKNPIKNINTVSMRSMGSNSRKSMGSNSWKSMGSNTSSREYYGNYLEPYKKSSKKPIYSNID